MLSTAQCPHPVEEIRWHVAQCNAHRSTRMPTTKVITGLRPGESTVAFYADASLDNRLLGWGTFEGFTKGTEKAVEQIDEIPLYAAGNHPPNPKGILHLSNMQEAAQESEVDVLDGEMTANQLPLTRSNLPAGPARGLVYYHSTTTSDAEVESVQSARSADPMLRRAHRVLAMVNELHKRGYQQLRIVPGMNSSGTAWRVLITPASNILRSHGAMPSDYEIGAIYSSAMSNEYFGWKDASSDTARTLADKFVQRNSDLLKESVGADWSYVGWYVEMLGHAERGYLPVAYADWYEQPRLGYLPTLGDDQRLLPMPPGGQADG
jgi:hypothetical protein